MKNIIFLTSILVVLASCDNTTKQINKNIDASILPHPKTMVTSQQSLLLSSKSKLYSANTNIYQLLEVLSSDIESITGIKLKTTNTKNRFADIIFEIDSTLIDEEYIIDINEVVKVKGGNYLAMARAKSTLLQLITKDKGVLKLPVLHIKDYPDAAYRGLMIDLARKWHDINTIKKIIDLAAYYKVNYLQLHFTDNQSYTLPSKVYPKLPTKDRHYSFDELNELEEYSQLRGITIIPEIDVPGHSRQFISKYPEIFGIKDSKANPEIINMGKEDVYKALDTLIGEVLSVFKSTPYFHIGGDEARFNGVNKDPDVMNYIAKHNIGDDVHDLFNHFLVRMNSIVKKHNKQMCVWEGFGPESKIKIPNDIIVFPFETNRYLPNELIASGYSLVNVSWKPLYVVNYKKWEPKTIYNWNMYRWENWWEKAPSFDPIQINKTNQIIGAQMCSWEQNQKNEISSLRKRLPAFVERIWNTEYKIDYSKLIEKIDYLDKHLSILIEDNSQDSLLFNYNFDKEKQQY